MTSTKPAGSLEPMKTSVTKWHHGIDASGLTQLEALAKDINKTIDATVKHVARGKIKVGKLLLEARAMFIEDQAFGKWRKDNTLVQSKQHAHYLMKVAERFHDAPQLIDGANYSVLQELILAEQKDIEWVEARIESGDPPTMVETREQVKKTKGTSKKALKMSGSLKHVQMDAPNTPINALVQLGLTRRIQQVVEQGIKGIEGHLVILGMDPDPQCPCHPDTLLGIRTEWVEAAENDHEEHVVTTSYSAVYKEFKNWNTRS
jgi:hypothetical protein